MYNVDDVTWLPPFIPVADIVWMLPHEVNTHVATIDINKMLLISFSLNHVDIAKVVPITLCQKLSKLM